MSKELVIASNRQETKVAILEEDQLVEVYFQRSNEYSLAGSIHKGRVTRVLPGMQSAFVDLGLERDTFLYVSDFFEENEDIDTVTEDRGVRRERGERRPGERPERQQNERYSSDRGQDRGSGEGRRERGEQFAAPTRFATPEAPVLEPFEASAAEELPLAIEIAPVGEVSLPLETLAVSRPQEGRSEGGDRGRGDRRGRRSRRRRPRGQGFPDNKYAQPSALEAEPAGAVELEPEEEAEETTPLILPGESLAKYRQPVPVRANQWVAAVANPVYEDEPTGPTDPEEIAAIQERAEELQAADLILSHSSSEVSAAEAEEKIEEVQNDQPASPFIVSDIEAEDFEAHPVAEHFVAENTQAEAFDPEHEEPVTAQAELRETAPVAALRLNLPEPEVLEPELPATAEQPETNGLAVAELVEDRRVVHAGEAGITFEEREELELDAAEAGEFEGADLEDAQVIEAAEGAEQPVAGEGSETRSASVREQGGRSMHRVSRRMRRRRGGSRFGQQGQPQQREEGTPFEAATAAGPAAAIAVPTPIESRRDAEARTDRPERVLPSISDLLKPGQELIVQIAKEPLGQKGARITSHVALPGRYVVFMPSVSHLGVSRKVESEEERQRLKRILQTHRVGTTGGFIVRTAGEGVPEDEIAADMDFLYKLWLDIRQKAEKRPAPMLLHYDLDVVQRILRDQVTEDFKAIWVDNEEMYESVLSFVQRFQPNLVGRVKMYTREAPIFDAFNITQELEKALRPKVWLKSGGYIVINQTEALVAIDINTGKYVGKSNRLEDTIVKTNTEAVKEIVRQIRLRDLGGIIVVDFIDMDERKNRQKVMQALEEAMQSDKAPYKILQFNDFGLVAITRKRVKQSLERTLCAPCPYCEGAGYVKSVQTIIGEILVEAHKIRKALDRNDVLLRVHPDVAKVLKANDNRYLEELEETLGRPVLVKGDPALHHEKFDLG